MGGIIISLMRECAAPYHKSHSCTVIWKLPSCSTAESAAFLKSLNFSFSSFSCLIMLSLTLWVSSLSLKLPPPVWNIGIYVRIMEISSRSWKFDDHQSHLSQWLWGPQLVILNSNKKKILKLLSNSFQVCFLEDHNFPGNNTFFCKTIIWNTHV